MQIRLSGLGTLEPMATYHSGDHFLFSFKLELEAGVIEPRRKPSAFALACSGGQIARHWESNPALLLSQALRNPCAPDYIQEQRIPQGLRHWLEQLSNSCCVAIEWRNDTEVRQLWLYVELETTPEQRARIDNDVDAFLSELLGEEATS